MYLKSIEVQGFKSFANKICFEFHNGITGIVGPNGSGKSNVADAVRWVLGEQSAKQLRGGNMQDVIFSGTENRKPLGFASVAITMDNSDRKLDIEYNEVTVTRRLYRSGESEYLLNGCSCRLKDINELFYDTGIGKEGYSIIGQGQIDKILSGKPEDRRELFDEAAGIVKFKRRKNTALKKLGEEQQNLTRVNDILSELTRQLGPMERQAEKAKFFLEKKEYLKQLEASLFLTELKISSEKLAKLEKDCQAADEKLKYAASAFEKTKEEYESLEHKIETIDIRIEELKEKTGEEQLAQKQLEGQIAVLREQINTRKQTDEHYRQRIAALREELERCEKAAEAQRGEKETLMQQAAVIAETEQEKEKELAEIQELAQRCGAAIEENQTELIELLNRRASTRGKLQRYDAMQEQIQIRKSGLNQRLLQTKSDQLILKEQREAYEAEYQRITDTIQDMTQRQQQAEMEIKSLQKELAGQNHEMENGQRSYHRGSSRLESLKNLAERYEGFGGSIRRVMEQKNKAPGILGVVADLIQTEQRYETAMETALGGNIQNIVTDNERTAKEMIEFLKRNRFGRATFLPLTTVKAKGGFFRPEILREQGVIGAASTLVHTEDVYRPLIESLLGRTLVVEHIDKAIVIGKKYHHSIRMVTLEGELLNPGGSMTGGAFKNNSNLLGRRREIEELEKKTAQLKQELERLIRTIDENRKRRNECRDRSMQLSDQIREQLVSQNTARMNLEQVSQKLDEGQEENARVRSELKEIDLQMREIEEASSEIRGEMENSQNQEKELENKTLELQNSQEKYRSREEEKLRALEEIHLQTASLEQKKEFVNENLARLKSESRSCTREIEQIFAGMRREDGQIEEREEQIRELSRKIEENTEVLEKLDAAIRTSMERREEMSQTQKTFFARRDQLSNEMSLLDKESFRLAQQKEKAQERRESRIQYMWEEYELTPRQAQEYQLTDEEDEKDLKAKAHDCRNEIRRLGPVNVNAVEEYQELKERHDFLRIQHDDLVEASRTLQNIIEELDEGMRRQFVEKFEEIRREFDRVFRELFGGGKGTLELLEEEDVLEAGIRIISQPPGKKLQNMMQLSGGEKALTAIALLFAIQNLKPSPFCLLDEIEAALDDSNVTRFAEYLHKLTKNTQFIIITHRRGTMTAADRLYGITMQEKGVSALVSVNLIEHDLDQ